MNGAKLSAKNRASGAFNNIIIANVILINHYNSILMIKTKKKKIMNDIKK